MDREEPGLLYRYPATPRTLLTVDEYHRMGDAGILTEDDRVELIEGELVAMAPIGGEHVATTNALTRLLVHPGSMDRQPRSTGGGSLSVAARRQLHLTLARRPRRWPATVPAIRHGTCRY